MTKLDFILLFISLPLFFQGCSSFGNSKNLSETLSDNSYSNVYDLEDKSGRFVVERKSGYLKNKNQLVLKRQVFSSDDPEKKPLEKSIVISTPGSLKKINVLRPLRSQYTVWFEKKKYFTEMKLDVKKKSLEVRMVSPEKQWNGVKHVSFPRGKGVYCFFSQVVDCVALTGFINEAVKREAGEMYFHLIWEGYPYFMEQYLNIKEEVFTRATFKYDGKTGDGHFRFTLEAGGQSLFYLLDGNSSIKKLFWVAQGYTQSYRSRKSN